MKNLLACYANCRFSTRCDELRNEIIEKPEQAAADINAYLGERGMRLIQIQFPKRGVKFPEAGRQVSESRPGKGLLRIEGKAVATGRPPAALALEKVGERRGGISKVPGPGVARRSAPAVVLEGEGGRARPKRRLKAGMKKARAFPDKLQEDLVKEGEREPQKKASSQKATPSKKRAAGKKALRARAPAALTAKVKPRSEARVVEEKPVRKKSAKKAAAAVSRSRRAAVRADAGNAIKQEITMSEQFTDKEKSARPKKGPSNKRVSAASGRSGRKQGKKFIILEGKTASLVDEQGLMMHIMSGPSEEARYFEVNEVEARVQIVSKK
jgi:hypothetical protein